ncbi:hypothetical protein [Asticcacaulis machinosus]|uniref:Uncharacterized protein n=1 Tax=Asticcacaulis machinosus TaxID=2984211 RepID=A0ABT5HHG0_9CAUL|nr:hypothetical protein [Asticcacaulis machinosus]MDC7675551.1 hypothetical protein [Asticcacaulis machinosus]
MDDTTSDTASSHPRLYYAFGREQHAFAKTFAKCMNNLHQEIASEVIGQDNLQNYQHGGSSFHPASPNLPRSELKESSAIMETKFEDIIGQNLALLPQALQHLHDAMTRNFYEMLFSGVTASCDRVGNTVSALDYANNAEAMLDALRKVEFSVDRNGKVTLPEILVGPGSAEPMRRDLDNQPQSFRDEWDAVIKEKSGSALAREVERRQRFKGLQQ